MGGTVIIIASLIGYFVGHFTTGDRRTASGLLMLMLMTGLGVVGLLDDFIKIYKQRSLGLRSGAKLAGQAVVGAVFAMLVLRFRDGYDLTPADAHFSFLRDFGPSISPVLFGLWVVFMIAAMSNGVNLTDGLDGLATGAARSGARRLRDHRALAVPQRLHAPRHAAVLPGPRSARPARSWPPSVLGACIGFLWWNAPPARIFMGDSGSLALGGVLAGLAVCTKTQLLLPILGGLFVLVTLSVVIQVSSFKLDRPPGVQDDPAAPPLRAARLGRNHDRDQILAGLRAVHRPRPGDLLRAVDEPGLTGGPPPGGGAPARLR